MNQNLDWIGILLELVRHALYDPEAQCTMGLLTDVMDFNDVVDHDERHLLAARNLDACMLRVDCKAFRLAKTHTPPHHFAVILDPNHISCDPFIKQWHTIFGSRTASVVNHGMAVNFCLDRLFCVDLLLAFHSCSSRRERLNSMHRC